MGSLCGVTIRALLRDANKNYLFKKDFCRKKTKTRTKTKTKTKTKTETKTKTNTKNEKDSTCAIFSESRGCKDIKYDLFTKKFSRNFPNFF